MSLSLYQKQCWPSVQKGLSLVELMISIALGLTIMAGVIQLFVNSSQNSITAQGASRIQENIRYALDRMGEDIARAGNMGCLSFAAAGDANNPYIFNRLDNIVLGDGSWSDFENSFISGVDQDALANAILDGTDTLIVKYVDSSAAIQIESTPGFRATQMTVADDDGLRDGQLVFAGNCNGIYVFNISGAPIANVVIMGNANGHDIDTNGAISYLYAGNSGAYEYYIGTSVSATAAGLVCSAAAPLNCSLYRSTNGNAQELVTGVSALQVSYGYENTLNDSIATDGPLTVDRIQVQMTFNAANVAGGVLSRPVTRVFAVRNQL